MKNTAGEADPRIRSFDYDPDLVSTPEARDLVHAADRFIKSLGEREVEITRTQFLDMCRDLILVLPYLDACRECVRHGDAAADWRDWCGVPHRTEVDERGRLRAHYRCHKGHGDWLCDWSVDVRGHW